MSPIHANALARAQARARDEDDDTLSVRQASRLTRISARTLCFWLQHGKIPGAYHDPIDPFQSYRIPRSALRAHLEQRRQEHLDAAARLDLAIEALE